MTISCFAQALTQTLDSALSIWRGYETRAEGYTGRQQFSLCPQGHTVEGRTDKTNLLQNQDGKKKRLWRFRFWQSLEQFLIGAVRIWRLSLRRDRGRHSSRSRTELGQLKGWDVLPPHRPAGTGDPSSDSHSPQRHFARGGSCHQHLHSLPALSHCCCSAATTLVTGEQRVLGWRFCSQIISKQSFVHHYLLLGRGNYIHTDAQSWGWSAARMHWTAGKSYGAAAPLTFL